MQRGLSSQDRFSEPGRSKKKIILTSQGAGRGRKVVRAGVKRPRAGKSR